MTAARLSIATWNVNSVRRRMDGLRWLAEEVAPDILCLQETKVADGLFPAAEIAALGYPHQAISGMKAYNGVAVLSKRPLHHVEARSWCGRDDARHIHATIDAGDAGEVELHSLYVPAGGDVADPLKNPKFAHKLDFLTELTHWWAARGEGAGRRVMVGDFNIAPLASDVWSHERLRNVVTHTEIEIRHLLALQASARWVDAIRLVHPETEPVFTWWSYRAADWQDANKGRRLDHIWVSPDLVGRVDDVRVFREARDWAPPSDHVPVIMTLKV
ncbi:MAG: exodeoxyribonuclease III [Magnetovibrio sp.]|nr:exodeoxyribonuclease III [Magnetovibrio sp.]